jgi:hypothetical protein
MAASVLICILIIRTGPNVPYFTIIIIIIIIINLLTWVLLQFSVILYWYFIVLSYTF